MKKMILCIAALLTLMVPAASAKHYALLHGIDYPPAGEKWYAEAFALGVMLSIWPEWWPIIAGDVRFGALGPAATRNSAHGDFMALPAGMGAGDFFLYYFTGHGSFTLWNPPGPVPETRPPALNQDCEEHIVFNLPAPRGMRDDEVFSLIDAQIPAGVPQFHIFNSCYAGGMINGMDPAGNAGDPILPFPPPPVVPGDLEGVAGADFLAAVSENETAPAGPAFNNALIDALKPVFNFGTLRFEPKGDTNGDGKLSVGEWIAHVTGIHPPGAPPMWFGLPDCPPGGPQKRGSNTNQQLNPVTRTVAAVDSFVVASPLLSFLDADGDSLTDHQETVAGTDSSLADSDADGLNDYEEIFVYFTSPTAWDTDGGGVGDGQEIDEGTDPRDPSDDGGPTIIDQQPDQPTDPDAGAGSGGPGDLQRAVLIGAEPNPFNPATIIVFETKVTDRVNLSVYDNRGRLIRTLANETFGQGVHRRRWDGLDRHGARVAAGVYLVKLRTGNTVEVMKIALLK